MPTLRGGRRKQRRKGGEHHDDDAAPIALDNDEDIDDDLAFDTDDEERFGSFYDNRANRKTKNPIERDFDKLHDGDDEYGGSAEGGSSDGGGEGLNLSDLIAERRARAGGKRTKNQRKVKSARERVTSHAESLFVSQAPKGATEAASMRQLTHTVDEAKGVKRLREIAGGGSSTAHALIPSAVLPEKKQRVERAEVRKTVEAAMKKWRPAVMELKRAKQVSYPLRPSGEHGAVPSTLGAIAAATQNEIQREARTTAPTLAKQIDDALKASGLKPYPTEKKSRKQQQNRSSELSSYVKLPTGAEESVQEPTAASSDKPLTREYVLRLRGMLGSEMAKRKRFNKIRSKTYRRILRREKEHELERRRQAMSLRNPEGAKRRLQAKMEKLRAEERITQRHKNSSKWVRHAKRFAKFDPGVREALGEQAATHSRLLEQVQEPADEEARECEVESLSEEEDRQVDELLDSSRGPEAAKESILWNTTHQHKTTSNNLNDPIEKARGELRGLGFMKRAAERHDAELQTQWEELRADVERHHKGLPPVQSATTIHDDLLGGMASDEEERKRMRQDDTREIHAAAKHHSVIRKVVELSSEKKTQGGSITTPHTNKNTNSSKGAANVAVANIAANRPSGLAPSTAAGVQKQQRLPPNFGPDSIATPEVAAPPPRHSKGDELSRGRKRTRESEEVAVTAPQHHPSAVAPSSSREATREATAAITARAPAPDEMHYQEALVARAFARDDGDDEFAAFKERQVEEIAKPRDPTAALPGWGEWGGTDPRLNQRHRERVAKLDLEHSIETSALRSARLDATLSNVVINHEVDLVPTKYAISMIPRPFADATDFHRSMRQPLGPEWNTSSTFRDGVAPRVRTVAGAVIDPLDRATGRKVVPKTKLRQKRLRSNTTKKPQS